MGKYEEKEFFILYFILMKSVCQVLNYFKIYIYYSFIINWW